MDHPDIIACSFLEISIGLKRVKVQYEPWQCGILTSVDSDEPVQPLLSLETPNGVQSVA